MFTILNSFPGKYKINEKLLMVFLFSTFYFVKSLTEVKKIKTKLIKLQKLKIKLYEIINLQK